MRSRNILRALQQLGTVEVMVLDEEERADEMSALSRDETGVAEALKVLPFGEDRSMLRKAAWTFNPRMSYPHGFGVDDATSRRVVERCKDFDVVWFWTLRAADMFPAFSWKASVVDIDDVPSTLERTKLQVAGGQRDRILTYRRLLTWRRREKLLDRRFSVLAVCSDADRQYLGELGVKAPVHVIPNGWDPPELTARREPASPPRLGFIGVFGHEPNRDGIAWFLGECWPRIKAEIPDARLRLVGPGSDARLSPGGPDVEGLGWVTDPSEEMNTWSAMIVPIRIGAGSRVKVAQAVCHRCPLVSTRFGAQGYEAAHGDGISIADSAEDFAASCISAIRNPVQAAAMAERALSHHIENWTWNAIQPNVWAAAEECLRRARAGVAV
jgi:glycosyltransferase involved in cell wall biosynthesis